MDTNNEYSDYVEKKISAKEYRDSFWARIDKNAANGCWEWTGAISNGCGLLCVRDKSEPTKDGRGRGRTIVAHRLAYRLLKGKWPSKWLLHECNNGRCVRVGKGHLWEGDHADSIEQRVEQGRTARMFGEDNGRSKLTEEQVATIRRRAEKGEKVAVLVAAYGISDRQMRDIIGGKYWAED